jgi:hypothetical protein
MFPISSKRRLSFTKIADYWSREIRARPLELLNELCAAWWRGELAAASGPSRADVFQSLYQLCSDRIAFATPDSPDPPLGRELSGGSLEVIRPVRIPLPNVQFDSWDDTNWKAVFEAVADAWEDLSSLLEDAEHVAEPIVAGLELTEAVFTGWITAKGYSKPNFWASGEEKDQASSPTQRISKASIKNFARDYIASEIRDGRQPTQVGFEELCRERLIRGRDLIRPAYKEMAKQAQINVRPGRYSERK